MPALSSAWRTWNTAPWNCAGWVAPALSTALTMLTVPPRASITDPTGSSAAPSSGTNILLPASRTRTSPAAGAAPMLSPSTGVTFVGGSKVAGKSPVDAGASPPLPAGSVAVLVLDEPPPGVTAVLPEPGATGTVPPLLEAAVVNS